MILLHTPYIRYREFHYFEEQSDGLRDIVLILLIMFGIFAAMLLIGHVIGVILKRQTEEHMKFIFQLYPCGTVNQKPSLIEQTEEQAIKTAKELSIFYNCLVIVRYPDNHSILCMAENGELTEHDTLKTLEFI